MVSLEIMVPTPAIRNLIREDKVHQIYSAMQTGQEKVGMQTANQSLASLHLAGQDHAGNRAPGQLESRRAAGNDQPRRGDRPRRRNVGPATAAGGRAADR